MARIQTLNQIADAGLDVLRDRGHEVGPDVRDPHGIIVRSANLHELEFGPSLLGIARAGAGVNNVPLDRCTRAGIAVINTPGSNANSVKELVVAGLMVSSRRIIEGYLWVNGLTSDGEELHSEAESAKRRFAGPEVAGKRLGVVGLGAIGVMVANTGEALGMEVIGFDPYLSIENAWGLSRTVDRASGLEQLVASVDYLTIHAPLNDYTRGMIGADLLRRAKPGLRLLNFARGGLVDTKAVLDALHDGIISRYVSDFPEAQLRGVDGVITFPHLGASTPEAEVNSARMAARQLADYVESGNVRHGVNLPDCSLEVTGGDRIVFVNKNVPNMVGQVTTLLAGSGINISNMINRHRGELAYNIIDVDGAVDARLAEELRTIEGIVRLRVITAGRAT